MLNINSLSFTILSKPQVIELLDWAKNEGWNPGLSDAEIFWQTDNEGFYGFFNGNEMIAGGSIVSYNGEFGFMGLFIVKPAYRHLGIGKKIWHLRKEKLLSRLKNGAAIGMDGVVDMQGFYSKGGFNLLFKDERYLCNGESFTVHNAISSITASDYDDIIKYDTMCFGFNRNQFIIPWINNLNSFAFKYKINDKLKGFAVMRKAVEGYKIGPLFADDFEVAEAMYKACLSAAQNQKVFIDIPLSNQDAIKLVNQFNAIPVFQCGRMYHGTPPQLPLEKIFGITTFELG